MGSPGRREDLQVTGTTASSDGVRGAYDPSPSPHFSNPPRAPILTPLRAKPGREGVGAAIPKDLMHTQQDKGGGNDRSLQPLPS